MKTDEEMMASLLQRRNAYEKRQKAARRHWGTAAACACLVTVLGMAGWQLWGNPACGDMSNGDIISSGAEIEYEVSEKDTDSQEDACMKDAGWADELGVLIYNHKKYMQSTPDGQVVKGECLGDTGNFAGNYVSGDGTVYLVANDPDALYIELANGSSIYLRLYGGGESVPKHEDADSATYSAYIEEITKEDWPAWYGGYFYDGGKLYVYVTEETDEVRAAAREMFGECECLWGKYNYDYLTALLAQISKGMAEGKLSAVTYACVLDAENCVEVCVPQGSADVQKQIQRMDTVGGAVRFKITGSSVPAETEDIG